VTSDPTREASRRLTELEAEARHASERYRLYRAKAYGPRLTSPGRLRELERESEFAERRLQRAKAEHGAPVPR
jgi:hypothetical protein